MVQNERAGIQEELRIGIGNEEAVTLKPETVKVINVRIEEVGTKKAKKLVCSVKHSAKQEPISISSVKYENKGKLETAGLWVNLDAKGLIRKGSALATFLQYAGCKTPEDLILKDLQTTTDEKNYLCFKAY